MLIEEDVQRLPPRQFTADVQSGTIPSVWVRRRSCLQRRRGQEKCQRILRLQHRGSRTSSHVSCRSVSLCRLSRARWCIYARPRSRISTVWTPSRRMSVLPESPVRTGLPSVARCVRGCVVPWHGPKVRLRPNPVWGTRNHVARSHGPSSPKPIMMAMVRLTLRIPTM